MIRIQLILFLLASLALPAPAQETAPEAASGVDAGTTLLRLYDGGILWGSIESHDAERLAFRRIDTGGLVQLEWSRLDPVQSEELLQRFGYVDDSSDEVMTEADRLVLRDGTELVGKIVNRTDEAIWLKTANRTIPVPKLRLRAGATVVQVPALDVYTREELYRQELVNLIPEDPASQLALAEFCERIFAFDEALAHLAKASELDPQGTSGSAPEVLANHAERLERKRANQEQIEVLREIDHLRARGKFDRALALAGSFEERFPASPLAPDARRKLQLVERSLEKALRDRVASLWHHAARKLVREKAMDAEVTFDAAIAWIDESLSEEILTRVHAELTKSLAVTLEPEEVRRTFDEREGGRWQKATYGQGTWLLGEGDALAGIEPTASKTGEQTELEAERERMAERIRRYLQNQEVVRRAKSEGSGGEAGEEQSFWRTWSSNGRSTWMLAYYAENGGDMQLREPIFRNCTQCGGTGVREIINTGSARSNTGRSSRGGRGGGQNSSNSSVIACPTCKHIGKWRTVSFR